MKNPVNLVNGSNTASKSVTSENLFSKIANCCKKAGRELVENVLILWYAFPDASASDKLVILAALAYFISPVDAIPDVLPGGFADDLSVVLGAVAKIRVNASPEVLARAKRMADEWFC